MVGAALTAAGLKPPVNSGRGDLAVQGYDVVAYTTGAAVRGTPEFEHRWNGALWRFASAANRGRFAASPEAYAPQFGGYCAWAVSRGYTADIDPQAFTVVNGKLYLNYSKSVRARWERDVPGNISRAEANWPAVLSR
jgi:hypothetical protein